MDTSSAAVRMKLPATLCAPIHEGVGMCLRRKTLLDWKCGLQSFSLFPTASWKAYDCQF